MANNTPPATTTTTQPATTAPAAAPAKGKAKAKANVPTHIAKAVPAAAGVQAAPPAGAAKYKLGKPLPVRAGTMRAVCMALVQHLHSTYRGGFYIAAINAGMVAQHGPKQIQARWGQWCAKMGIITPAS